jgi:hypothetical protein
VILSKILRNFEANMILIFEEKDLKVMKAIVEKICQTYNIRKG